MSLLYCSVDMVDECQPDGESGWCIYDEGEDFDEDDEIFCVSNAIDCDDICDGEKVWDAGLEFTDEGEEIIEWASCCHPDDLAEDGFCEDLSLEDILIPDEFSIHNIYPNPFNPRANIVYALPEYAHVNVTVYYIRGRVMEVLTNGFETAGYYTINWDASSFASGVYFVEMYSESFRETRKVLHMK